MTRHATRHAVVCVLALLAITCSDAKPTSPISPSPTATASPPPAPQPPAPPAVTRFAVSTTASRGWQSIEVFVSGRSIGVIRRFFEPGTPVSCTAIDEARLSTTVQPGTTTYSARSNNGSSWSGSVQIQAGGCVETQLTCDNRDCSPPPAPAPPAPAPPVGSSGGFHVWGGRDYAEYLGFYTCVFCKEFGSDSINNEFGRHGSQFSSTSIRNDFSQYGSEFSTYSACNPFASNPPRVYNQTRATYYGELTLNQFRSAAITTANVVDWLRRDVCAALTRLDSR